MNMPALRGGRLADQLNVFFLLILSAVVFVFRGRIEGAAFLLGAYLLLVVVQAALVRVKGREGLYRITYDLIFPTLTVLFVFDSLERIVHSINPRDLDPLLIRLDYLLVGGYPTVMLEGIMHPLLTDMLQLAYSSYYFLPVALGISLKLKGDEAAFDRSLFLILFCFYLSYVGYLLVPALGPRYVVNHLQNAELEGLFIAEPIQRFLNGLEGVKRDAFPSGHTGIALTVLYLAYLFERKLFVVMLPVVSALVFATVYCRYHYVVDVIGGLLLALVTIGIGEAYYGYRAKGYGPRR